jgi:hypothetical protein
MLKTLRRKLRGFHGLPRFSQIWLLPMWCVLGVAKVVIVAVSFRRLAPYLGQPCGVAAWVPLLDARQQARALQIGQVVRLAARYTPWESNCFTQAVAARLLLGHYEIPYALFFGLKRDVGCAGLEAHAWVAAGRVPVIGGSSFGSFVVVGVFVAPGLGAAWAR